MVRPQCAIYGFDLWVPDYAGGPNPGPEFVQEELARVGHEGDLVLESGDSRTTLPAFLERHPDLYFDVITIDGDKSVPVVASDYANALPRLKIGGVVVTAIFGFHAVRLNSIAAERTVPSYVAFPGL